MMLLLGPALALVAAAPAVAAEVTVGVDDSNSLLPTWTPPEVAITPGDTVVWNLDSAVQVHDVAAASEPGFASWEGFTASPPAKEGKQTFTTPGRYRFVCRFHSGQESGRWTGMVGTVVVGDPPPPPPLPLSAQPFPNDGALPGVLETGGLDTTRPTLRSVRVQRMKLGAKISFRVSEQSVVTVRFKRGGKVVKTTKLNASGNYRGTFRDRKRLRAGRYRVELRAEDVAGNLSGMRTAGVTIRRR
jgi:plastocyanin